DVYSTDYKTANFSTKLRKMNYDIHVGSILGFPGKVMAFLASLIGASLPITGFLIWYGRKFKKKKSKTDKPESSQTENNHKLRKPVAKPAEKAVIMNQ